MKLGAIMIAAGAEPEDTGWWSIVDLLRHALDAVVLFVRAAAGRQGLTIAEVCRSPRPLARSAHAGHSALMDYNGTERADAIAIVVAQLIEWRDVDEPMVEAIGNTLAEVHRLDSQEQARRVLSTVITVLEREANATPS